MCESERPREIRDDDDDEGSKRGTASIRDEQIRHEGSDDQLQYHMPHYFSYTYANFACSITFAYGTLFFHLMALLTIASLFSLLMPSSSPLADLGLFFFFAIHPPLFCLIVHASCCVSFFRFFSFISFRYSFLFLPSSPLARMSQNAGRVLGSFFLFHFCVLAPRHNGGEIDSSREINRREKTTR
jgi:hypothetical protein